MERFPSQRNQRRDRAAPITLASRANVYDRDWQMRDERKHFCFFRLHFFFGLWFWFHRNPVTRLSCGIECTIGSQQQLYFVDMCFSTGRRTCCWWMVFFVSSFHFASMECHIRIRYAPLFAVSNAARRFCRHEKHIFWFYKERKTREWKPFAPTHAAKVKRVHARLLECSSSGGGGDEGDGQHVCLNV